MKSVRLTTKERQGVDAMLEVVFGDKDVSSMVEEVVKDMNVDLDFDKVLRSLASKFSESLL